MRSLLYALTGAPFALPWYLKARRAGMTCEASIRFAYDAARVSTFTPGR